MSGKKTKRARQAQLEAERQAALEAARRRQQSRRPLIVGIAAAGAVLLLAAVGATVFLGERSAEEATPPAANTAPATGAETSPEPAAGLPATPDYHSLLVAGDNILLGSHAGIHVSTDSARTWSQTDFSGDAMNLAQSPNGTLWAAGHDVFSRSDEGKSWTTLEPTGLPSLDLHGFAVDPKSGDLYAAPAGQGLYRSDDEGKSFSLVSNEVAGGHMALTLTPDGRILAGDMEAGLMLSDDGGKTWRRVLQAALMGLAANPSDPKRIIASGSSLYLSTDGGAAWRAVLKGSGDGFGPVAWADAKTGYAVAFAGVLYRTNDGGRSWQELA